MNTKNQSSSVGECTELPRRLREIQKALVAVKETSSASLDAEGLLIAAVETLLSQGWEHRKQWASDKEGLGRSSGAELLLRIAGPIGSHEVPSVSEFVRRAVGKMCWSRFLDYHGGTYSAEEAAREIGGTPEEVAKGFDSRQLIGFDDGNGMRYPAFQFVDGDVLPHFAEVLQRIDSDCPVAHVRFFLSYDSDLGMTPAEALVKGLHLDLVRRKAAQEGKQVAR